MLKPAQLYESELIHRHEETWYDLRYMYARAGMCAYDIQLPNNTAENHSFVSIYKDAVIGLISYNVDLEAMSASDLFIESYDIGNPIFVKDCFDAVCNIFEKYNLARLDCNAIEGNPATKTYRKFIKMCGGREVGFFKNKVRLMDGQLHDQIYFEILSEDFLKWRHNKHIKGE